MTKKRGDLISIVVADIKIGNSVSSLVSFWNVLF
jgi:hypothetical protein